MLEMSLLLPVFMILVIGVIDVGRYTQFSILVANAAHSGAVYGAQNLVDASDSTGIANVAVQDSGNTLQASNVTTTLLCGCSVQGLAANSCPASCGATSLTYVQVQVQGTFQPVFGAYMGLPTTVTKTAEMRVSE